MTVLRLGVLLGAVLVWAGCSTAYLGQAPAADGSVYVSGQYCGDATVWKCPAQGRGECKTVKVELN